MSKLSPIVECIEKSTRILLVSHVSPDIDTIGSMLAMGLALKKINKNITLFNCDKIPPSMDFLKGVDKIVNNIDDSDQFDATIFLDSGTPDRYGVILDDKYKDQLGKTIKIDHHLTGKSFTDFEYVDSNRACTGELVYDVILAASIKMDYDIAHNIYSAIMSDTGGFRYSNTNAKAFNCAGVMLDLGVNPWDISTEMYENKPEAQMRLLAEALSTLDIMHEGLCASLTISQKALKKTGADEYMLDGFVNYARSIKGVEVAVLISELKAANTFKISFRSKGLVNVAAIAEALGGGGHHNAAGCTITGKLDEIKKRLCDSLTDKLPKQKKRSAC